MAFRSPPTDQPIPSTRMQGMNQNKKNILLLYICEKNVQLDELIHLSANSSVWCTTLPEDGMLLQQILNFVDDMSNDVWMYITSTAELFAHRGLQTVLQRRQLLLDKEDKSVDTMFSIHLLLAKRMDIKHRLPPCWRNNPWVDMSKLSGSKLLARLESSYISRKTKLQTIAGKLSGEKDHFLEVTIRVQNDGAQSVALSFKNLTKMLSNHNSPLRCQWRTYHIYHVHILAMHKDTTKIILEIRPAHLQLFHDFMNAHRKGYLHLKLKEYLNSPTSEIITMTYNSSKAYAIIRMLQAEQGEPELIKAARITERSTGNNPFSKSTSCESFDDIDRERTHEQRLSAIQYLYCCCLKNHSTFERFCKEVNGLPKEGIREIRHKLYPALHLAILKCRCDLLKMFLDIGLWGSLCCQILKCSKGKHRYNGYTARSLAEELAHSDNRKYSDVLKTFNTLDKHWKSLNPLCLASAHSKKSLVTALLKCNVVDKHNVALSLKYASTTGNADLVRFLLDSLPDVQNLNQTRDMIQSAVLSHVLSYNDISKLITTQLNTDDMMGLCAKAGYTAGALMLLRNGIECKTNHIESATKAKQYHFIKHIFEKSSLAERARKMHAAAEGGWMTSSFLEVCIASGVNFTLKNTCNMNMMHLAVKSNNIDVVRIVMNRAKKFKCLEEFMNNRDTFVGKDIVSIAVQKTNDVYVYFILQYDRCLLNPVSRRECATILSCDSRELDSTTTEFNEIFDERLNEKQPDVTPLHMAVMQHNQHLTQMLLDERCVDVNAVDHFGGTPAHIAARERDLQIFHALRQRGADLEKVDNKGRTPWAIATINGHKPRNLP